MKHLLIISVFSFLFIGCTVKYKDIQMNNKEKFTKQINELFILVKSLSNDIDIKEAKSVAFEAIEYSKFLANKYEIVAPALFHNTLINLGIKQRGYCYHYANDLLRHLKRKKYKSFNFVKIISKRGEYFEHTSIILTKENIKFEDSIVLDAWRNEGKLYFSKIKDDKNYNWEKK